MRVAIVVICFLAMQSTVHSSPLPAVDSAVSECAKPEFATALVTRQSGSGYASENAATVAASPGADQYCVFAAAWKAENAHPGDTQARLYVATFLRDSGKKRSDLLMTLEFEGMEYAGPAVRIDPALFPLKRGILAFAVRTEATRRGFAINSFERHFDLVMDDGSGTLRNVLSRTVVDDYRTDCDTASPRPEGCDGVVDTDEIYVVREAATKGYRDIEVKTFAVGVRTAGSNPRRALFASTLYRWNGLEYIVHSSRQVNEKRAKAPYSLLGVRGSVDRAR